MGRRSLDPPMISKNAILQHVFKHLGDELEMLVGASRAMHADASDEQNKAEDQYDTRGLETAYLASSQARQATATEEALAAYQALTLAKFTAASPIAITALVELEVRGERMWYFIGPKAGGIEVKDVFVITPESPIGQQLISKKVGDRFKFHAQDYKIISVR
ncbi:MAG: GreA/GreB family elongation factor [Verrucomicrobiota bacterium]